MTAARTRALNERKIDELWEAFGHFDADGSGAIGAEELVAVLASLGHQASLDEARAMIREVDTNRSGDVDFDEFKTLMVSAEGDWDSRLRIAFDVLDEDGSGLVTVQELLRIMGRFGLTEAELSEMVAEVDRDGDGSIAFEEFKRLAPDEGPDARTYSSAPVRAGHEAPPRAGGTTGTAGAEAAPAAAVDRDASEGIDRVLRTAQTEPPPRAGGTSLLQLQIGVFRLIQGAAYRCFRESYSANHETHLRVRNLPYRITDFARFVRSTMEFYKSLGVVDPACHGLIDAVPEAVEAEFAALEERILRWETIDKTPAMLAEAARMEARRRSSAAVRRKFAAGVEFAISLSKGKIGLKDAVDGVLAVQELNRLRNLELASVVEDTAPATDEPPLAYLDKWNRVILADDIETVDGAMLPVRFWYETFMPKLLAACSVAKGADIAGATRADEADLDAWFETARVAGEFARYGEDVLEGFAGCSPEVKLEIRQAWRLSRHYLNGVQKRRERAEFGRESGALSHYVAFLDVHLHRSCVRDGQMRVSFPYYLGPPVWRLFHTGAEIICGQAAADQARAVALFKEFFQTFATVYPCPYCRHHLNAYVVQNREVDMYPVEYLTFGLREGEREFVMSMDNKLSLVEDGPSLRLFFWKLHNTVSSSIMRSEAWYRRDDRALYTTRYWPGLDSELARARALRERTILSERIYAIYDLLRPIVRLSGLRNEMQRALNRGDTAALTEAIGIARAQVSELEAAVLDGGFLAETYRFDPDKDDADPSFTPEEEEYARSGAFAD